MPTIPPLPGCKPPQGTVTGKAKVTSPIVELARYRVAETVQRRTVPDGDILEMVDKLTAEQVAELHIQLAERPMAGTDPVLLALASTNALTDEELLEFFKRIKWTVDADTWGILIDQ